MLSLNPEPDLGGDVDPFAIGSESPRVRCHRLQLISPDCWTIRTPYSEKDIHKSASAAIKDLIHLMYIGFVIDNRPVQLHPRMVFECTNGTASHELRWPAVGTKNDHGRDRPLKTENSLRIEDAREIHGSTNTLAGFSAVFGNQFGFPLSHDCVSLAQARCPQPSTDDYQHEIASKNQIRHGPHLRRSMYLAVRKGRRSFVLAI